MSESAKQPEFILFFPGAKLGFQAADTPFARIAYAGIDLGDDFAGDAEDYLPDDEADALDEADLEADAEILADAADEAGAAYVELQEVLALKRRLNRAIAEYALIDQRVAETTFIESERIDARDEAAELILRFLHAKSRYAAAAGSLARAFHFTNGDGDDED